MTWWEIIITAFAGGLLTFTGYAVGLRQRPNRTKEPAKPICICGHIITVHDKDGCAGSVKPAGYGSLFSCACKRYVGPEADQYIPELDE